MTGGGEAGARGDLLGTAASVEPLGVPALRGDADRVVFDAEG
jgi:hypothetical protein